MYVIEAITVVILWLLASVALILGLGSLIVIFIKSIICLVDKFSNKDK